MTASLILIAGPTASGKSALAAALAARLNGVIINADAMQVYQGLPILTAQPDAAIRDQLPHRLYENIDPAVNFSAGAWLAAAQRELQLARANGQCAIFVGGTGLYFQALVQGLADIPEIPPTLRAQLRQDFHTQGEATIRARLAEHDPAAAAQIRPGDQLRLLRALEIVLATGTTQRDWQRTTRGGIGTAQVQPILLLPPRDALYAACERRFEQMVAAGAVAEVKALLARRLAPELPAMKIIGVREIAAFLAGELAWENACTAAQQATRHYAKRQMTWFRNQWLGNKIGFAKSLLVQEDFFRPDAMPQWIDQIL